MAIELLVRAIDSGGGRRRGDIILMEEIPHVAWGPLQGPPNYTRVIISDAEAKDFSQYHVRHGLLDPDENWGTDENPKWPETIRSRYRFNLDALPTAVDRKIIIQKDTATENLINRRIETYVERNFR